MLVTLKKPDFCNFCPLAERDGVLHLTEVGEKPSILIIGLRPARDELRVKENFVGVSGEWVRKMLEKCGVKSYLLGNIVRCEVRDDKEFVAAVKVCQRFAEKDLRRLKNKIRGVVLLGDATKTLIPILNDLEIPYVTLAHPASILRRDSETSKASYEQQFTMAVKRLVNASVIKDISYELIKEVRLGELMAVLKRAKLVAVDFEVAGTNDPIDPAATILSIAFYTDASPSAFVLPVNGNLAPYKPILNYLATKKELLKIFHYAIFDLTILMRETRTIVPANAIADTLLMAYALDENLPSYSLKNLAVSFLNAPFWDAKIEPYMKDLRQCPPELLFQYNANDAFWTYRLYCYLHSKLQQEPSLRYLLSTLLYPATVLFALATIEGIKVDMDYLNEVERLLQGNVSEWERLLVEQANAVGMTDFNPSSTKQLGKFLYEIKGFKPMVVTPKGEPSTSEEALLLLKSSEPDAVPIVDAILNYRKALKLLTTYVSGLRKHIHSDGKVRPSWKLHGTVSGRVTCINPPMQTIPAHEDFSDTIRGIFVPKDGCVFVEVDFKTHELRVAAILAGDDHALNIFKENRDIHKEVAAKIFNKPLDEVTDAERQVAKGVNFGILYGMGAKSLAKIANVSEDEAQSFIDAWFEMFPKVKEWQKELLISAKVKGYVEIPTGRRRRLKTINSTDLTLKSHAEREALNSPVQAFASDLCLLTAINFQRLALRHHLKNTQVLLTVHDSILIQTPATTVKDTLKLLLDALDLVTNQFNLPPILELEYCIYADRWGVNKKQPLNRETLNQIDLIGGGNNAS